VRESRQGLQTGKKPVFAGNKLRSQHAPLQGNIRTYATIVGNHPPIGRKTVFRTACSPCRRRFQSAKQGPDDAMLEAT
jgi:hypothetical protein